MKKTIISFVVTFLILIVLLVVTVLLATYESNKVDFKILIEKEEKISECLDFKEQVIVEEKNIENNFFWSKTYIIICLSSDEKKRYRFTVSSDAYYVLPIGKKLLYCNNCNRIFDATDE